MLKHLTRGLFSFGGRVTAAVVVCCAAWSVPAVAAAQSITPNANIAVVGQTLTFTVVGPPNTPTVLHFGDGTQANTGPNSPSFATHAYAAPGVYTVTLTFVGNTNPLATTTVTILDPASFSLTASPTRVIAGQAVNFTAVVGAIAPGAYVDFGDGTTAPAPARFNHLVHRYQNPGLYTARLLIIGQGFSFANAFVSVAPNPVNVPVGQVYSSFLVGSPVLAGADTSISLTYRIFTPFVIGTSGFSPLQAIVELTDSKGNVIQRSDPFVLPFTQQNVNAVQTAMIPYTVPADASGNYLVRVYVRVTQGGTVAVGRAQPLQIIGGTDPAPRISNAFHASGAILTNSGTTRGGYGVNLGVTTAIQWSTEELLLTGTFDPVSKRVDPVATLMSATPAPITAPDATAAPGSTSSQVDSGHVPAPPISGSPEPSKTPGPSATVPASTPTPKPKKVALAFGPASDATAPDVAAEPAAPTPTPAGPSTATGSAAEQASPAVTPPPTPAPGPAPAAPTVPTLNFKDVVGRTDAAMPAIIGSKETLRGIDATYALLSGWTFHGGGGYFQLPSQSTTERTGELIDVLKAWQSGADALRVAFSRNQDNVNKFVDTGTTGPLDVTAGVFEFTTQLTPHLRALLTGGRSNIRPETGGLAAYNDSVNQTDLTYSVGSTSLDLQYHNAGPQFGTLSGASALSDRAGGAASLSLTTSPISTLALGYGHDVVRSVFSRTTNATATFNITPPRWPGITVGLERDTAVAPGSDSLTKLLNIGLSKSGISSISVTGMLAAVSDALNPESYSTTRTGVFQYQYVNGAHTLGAGLNATNTTSTFSTGTVAETLNYGFTFGGRAQPNTTGQPLGAGTRNFETKFVLTNVNMHALASGGHTATLTGLLSWHVTPHLAPGFEFNYQRHFDDDSTLNSHTSFARFRLDVNI